MLTMVFQGFIRLHVRFCFQQTARVVEANSACCTMCGGHLLAEAALGDSEGMLFYVLTPTGAHFAHPLAGTLTLRSLQIQIPYELQSRCWIAGPHL